MTQDNERREVVARIIDPDAWSVADSTRRAFDLPATEMGNILAGKVGPSLAKADAILSLPPPAGWKLVPVEATEAMWSAGGEALSDLYRGDGGWIGSEAAKEQNGVTWRAMLSVSPLVGGSGTSNASGAPR